MEKDKLIKIRNTIIDQSRDITQIVGLSSLLIYGSNIDKVNGGPIVQAALGTIFVGSAIVVAYKGTEIIPDIIDEEINKDEPKVLKRTKK